MVVRLTGNTNPARFGDALKPSRDVHAVAEDILIIIYDDIAQSDAHAELDPLIDTDPGIPLRHAALHFDGATYRVNHRSKLYQHTVSGSLHDPTAMFFDFGVHEGASMRLQ